MLAGWNPRPEATAGLASGPAVHERFAAQAARRPTAIAAVLDGATLTYGELDRRSDALAWELRKMGVGGVGAEVLVGLAVERSFAMLVGLLAILKAGGAYLPLDPEYPRERLAYLLADSGVPVLLTQEELRDRLPETSAQIVAIDLAAPLPAVTSPPPGGVRPEHPAYVIYTSGSTGQPKGVAVTHGNAARLLDATQAWFGFGEEDTWTLFHSYAFDFSVWEIWGALAYGGRLVIVPYWTSRSPAAFYTLLAREKVTVLNQTPSAFRQLSWAE